MLTAEQVAAWRIQGYTISHPEDANALVSRAEAQVFQSAARTLKLGSYIGSSER
jgi:hypothetical protein